MQPCDEHTPPGKYVTQHLHDKANNQSTDTGARHDFVDLSHCQSVPVAIAASKRERTFWHTQRQCLGRDWNSLPPPLALHTLRFGFKLLQPGWQSSVLSVAYSPGRCMLFVSVSFFRRDKPSEALPTKAWDISSALSRRPTQVVYGRGGRHVLFCHLGDPGSCRRLRFHVNFAGS